MTRGDSDSAILRELVARSDRRDPPVPQFRSLAGAHQYLRLFARVRRHVPPGGRVLDWGAGAGHFSFFLARAGFRPVPYTIDPTRETGWLADALPAPVLGGDSVHLPFADGEFDAVASIGVLEHVREFGGDEETSLAELRRVLRAGGVLIAWHFPNRGSWIDRVARRTGRHHHEYRYDAGDITRLLAGARFDLEGAGRYGILPRNSVHRVLGPLARTAAGAALWDALDATLGVALAPVCQNWWFVARKPAA